MAKNKMKKTNTIHFGIQRKIVANMTTESWANVPHVTYNYEPDVTEFMIEYKRLNEDCPPEKKVTLNTLMLKIIVEGLKADPIMNSHIEFDRKLVRGEIHTFENIDISMPMVLPSGEMMTINLHNFENKNLDEMVSYIADVNRRVANTNLDEVMFDVSLDNTLTALKQGKIKQTLYRLIGSKTGKHKVKTLSGKEKSNYYKIPENDRLTKHDIEQGTITVSNIGSVYRAQRGETCLLEIVPPQVCAIAVGAVQDKPVSRFWKRTTWKRGGGCCRTTMPSWIRLRKPRNWVQTIALPHWKSWQNWQVIRLRQNPLHVLRQNCEVDDAAKMEPEF